MATVVTRARSNPEPCRSQFLTREAILLRHQQFAIGTYSKMVYQVFRLTGFFSKNNRVCWNPENLIFLQHTQEANPVLEHFAQDRRLFYIIIGTIFIVCLVFILAGIVIVAHSASRIYQFSLFGLEMTSTSLGIVSIALGSIVLIILYRHAMPKIDKILSVPREPSDR
jgi:uncharacterized Tic20 family protein